jgi:hypothetical protein
MYETYPLQELTIASPLIPQFHGILGPLFRDAGLPEGVLQILNFAEEDVAERVEQLVAHEDVRVSACRLEALTIDDQLYRVHQSWSEAICFMRQAPEVCRRPSRRK